MKTKSNIVILTHERLMHILNEHPEVIKHLNDIKDILRNPDFVFFQNDMSDTVWIVKKLEKNLKITLKLETSKMKNSFYKNSIIQMQYMHDKELRRNIINGKIKLIWNKNVEMMQEV